MTAKAVLYPWVLCALLGACRQQPLHTVQLSGQAQGTSYHISYVAGAGPSLQAAFDSIFRVIDASLSTYQPGSIISRINRNDSSAVGDAHFNHVFARAMEVSHRTGGAFDATVGPLINAWGFGFGRRQQVTPALIDSLLPLVGYRQVRLTNGRVYKAQPGIQLDFNAIAQGYTVDVLAEYLHSRGINQYLIELGGELRASGTRQDGQPWTVGLEQPADGSADAETTLQGVLQLGSTALATSGNYKRYYLQDGRKYAHILLPATGYPAQNNLLSATVLAPDCTTADAYATAFMVMGLEAARRFIAAHPQLALQALFIYTDEAGRWQTLRTPGFPPLLPVPRQPGG